MIAPTTAIAEIALVSDISGVCSRRETRRITPMPMKVARMNTNSMDVTSRPWAASARFRGSSGIGQSLLGLGVDDLAVVGDEGAGRRRDDLVLQIEGEDDVFGE